MGDVLDYLHARYAELATELSTRIEDIRDMKRFDPPELAALWTGTNDARGYVILGDPAVRLDFAADTSVTPTNTPIVVPATPAASASPPRPDGVGEADWAATPASVRALVARLLAERRS